MSSFRSSCWSSTIQRLLTPASDSNTKTGSKTTIFQEHQLTRSSTYPPGSIWRSFVARCVYQDLIASSSDVQVSFKHGSNPKEKPDLISSETIHESDSGLACTASGRERERRFARMNECGLGGVIMYEIPYSAGQDSGRWSVEGVFGDSDLGDPGKTGMSIEELLDGVKAKLVYIPLYACTSFVTGQIMNAAFHNRNGNDMRPIPVTGAFGFSVKSDAFTIFDEEILPDCVSRTTPSKPVLNLLGFLRRTQDPAPRFLKDTEAFTLHQKARPIEQFIPGSDSTDDQWELEEVENELTATSYSEDEDEIFPIGTSAPHGLRLILEPSSGQSSLTTLPLPFPPTSLSKIPYDIDEDVLHPREPALHSSASSTTISSTTDTECSTDISTSTSDSSSCSSGLSDALSQDSKTPLNVNTASCSRFLSFDSYGDLGLYSEARIHQEADFDGVGSFRYSLSQADNIDTSALPGRSTTETFNEADGEAAGISKKKTHTSVKPRVSSGSSVLEMHPGKENIPPNVLSS